MATIFGSIETLIHDTADALIQNQITTKVSDMYTGFVSAAFGIVNDSLKVVRDITHTAAATGPLASWCLPATAFHQEVNHVLRLSGLSLALSWLSASLCLRARCLGTGAAGLL